MKKYFLTLILGLILLVTTSCNLRGNKNINLPTTIEEVEQIISAVPNCYYEVDDLINDEFVDEENIPEGAEISVIAGKDKEFLIGVRFKDEDSLKKGYDKIVTLIEEVIEYEFEQEKNSYKIYDNDCWIYAGSPDFVAYFEGHNDKFIIQEETLIPFETIETRLKSNNFIIEIIEISKDSREYKEKGILKVILASNSAGNHILTLYQLESSIISNQLREELIDSLYEKYYEEYLDDLGWERPSKVKWGVYENYVYAGTVDAVAIVKGENHK